MNKGTLEYCHQLISKIVARLVFEGGGLVVSLVKEPFHNEDKNLPTIFDWTILETFKNELKSGNCKWDNSTELPVIAIGLPNWKEKISVNRMKLWRDIASTGKVRLMTVREGLGFGGILREKQSLFGDVLVTLGGGTGVEHLAEIYASKHKPIIPLDIPIKELKDKSLASGKLAKRALEKPDLFFEFENPRDISALFSTLSLRDGLIEIGNYERRFFMFVSKLANPRAFYIRLMDKEVPTFNLVEKFFRTVVDPVVRKNGFIRFEVNKDFSEEKFMNVEIFKELNNCSLVIADLTGLRPNCFMELGYAFGRKKNVVMTAMEGTDLPFDPSAISCYFWPKRPLGTRNIASFELFLQRNLNRGQLIKDINLY